MRKTWAFILIAMFLFPMTVGAKGGGFSSGARSSSPSVSRSPSPSTGGFKSGVTRAPGTSPSEARAAQAAAERTTRTTTYVHQTTVVNNGGNSGGGNWLLPAMLGYYLGGGCDRRERPQQPQDPNQNR